MDGGGDVTAHTWLGIAFIAVGVVVKIAQAAGLLVAGEIGYVGEITNAGFLLLGKELWPGSPQSLAVRKRTSIPPVALVLLLALVPGCATWADAKPVLRDVNDIARELCEATLSADAERMGVTVADLCILPHVIAPFLQAPDAARMAASRGAP